MQNHAYEQHDMTAPPNRALSIFTHMVCVLIQADGYLLIRRSPFEDVVVASGGLRPEMQTSILAENRTSASSQLESAKPVAYSISPSGGHLMDVRLGRTEELAYHCIFVRMGTARAYRGREVEALVRSLPPLADLLALEERAFQSEASSSQRLMVAQSGFWLLDQLGADIYLVDRELRAVLRPPTRDDTEGLAVVNRRLTVGSPEDQAKLQDAVSSVLSGDVGDASFKGVPLETADRRRPVLVAAVAPSGGDGQRRLAAVIVPRTRAVGCDEDVVRSMYGLTRVEAKIVALLSTGMTAGDVAKELRLSQNTLKGYMKNIFRTLDIHRQSDLIRLIYSTPGLLRPAKQIASRNRLPLRAPSEARQPKGVEGNWHGPA